MQPINHRNRIQTFSRFFQTFKILTSLVQLLVYFQILLTCKVWLALLASDSSVWQIVNNRIKPNITNDLFIHKQDNNIKMLQIINSLKIVPKKHCNMPLLHRSLTCYDIRNHFMDSTIKTNGHTTIGSRIRKVFDGEKSASVEPVNLEKYDCSAGRHVTDSHDSSIQMCRNWSLSNYFEVRSRCWLHYPLQVYLHFSIRKAYLEWL